MVGNLSFHRANSSGKSAGGQKDLAGLTCYDPQQPSGRVMRLQKAGSPAALIQRGNLLLVQGQLKQAADSYRQALALNPEAFDAHCNLGVVLSHQGDVAGAIDCYRQALKLNPQAT